MKSMILREFIGPLATRIGAVTAGFLVAKYGADPEISNHIGVGIAAFLALCVDLVSRKAFSKEGD